VRQALQTFREAHPLVSGSVMVRPSQAMVDALANLPEAIAVFGDSKAAKIKIRRAINSIDETIRNKAKAMRPAMLPDDGQRRMQDPTHGFFYESEPEGE
jgi:hypothetical protein